MPMDLTKFNPVKAAEAQKAYCEKNEYPQFAPANGICWYCNRNIYIPTNGSAGAVLGITVESAGNFLITGCPHCHHSYCD